MDDAQKIIRRQAAWEGFLQELPGLGVPEERVEEVRAIRQDGRLRDAFEVFEAEKLYEVAAETNAKKSGKKSNSKKGG